MSTKNRYSKDEYKSLLAWAIQEDISISVSLKTHTKCFIYSSQFQDLDEDLIFFSEPTSRVIDPRDPIQEVFVTFSRDHSTFSFAATYFDKHTCSREGKGVVSSLAVCLPEYIEETDRRNINRFYVEETTDIPVSFCLENDDTSKYSGYLNNVAMDGIGISIAISGEIGISNNQKCDISILSSLGQEVISIPARYRYCNTMDDQEKAILGFQFSISSDTVEGSKKLALISQLISHLQTSCRKELTLT